MTSISRNRALAVLGLGAGAVAAVGVLAGVRRRRATDDRVADLLSAGDRVGETVEARTFTREDLAGLPDPVVRYFEHVLPAGTPYAQSVRLDQVGEFRLGDRDSPWRPLSATQHFTVDPPGFVWDATIDVAPFVPAHVVDAYQAGTGSLSARVYWVLPVADATPGLELDEAELKRYLSEAVWFPTALLPESGVEWEAIDDRSARATLTDGATTASLVFHFDDRDEVERVTGERPYMTDDGEFERQPWVGYMRDYENRNGVRIPTRGTAAWDLPDGELAYWRGHVTAIDHRPATRIGRRSTP